MLARKTAKNKITLPMAIVRQLPDAIYFDVSLRNGEVVLRPVMVSAPSERLSVARAKVRVLGLTGEDVAKAIRWARGRRR